jgi:7,8-dihydro-6-hydroxymethylpterin dimethyltransferase
VLVGATIVASRAGEMSGELSGGKQIPFCAYNTIGYREQARAQLEAMEPARRRARAEGRRFAPTPITFAFPEARP